MNKSILTIAIALCSTCAIAQTKIPEKVTITLSRQQILKLDSIERVATSLTDSKSTTAWFQNGFTPIWLQVNKVSVDTVKNVTIKKQ